jgi:hypothetical protein
MDFYVKVSGVLVYSYTTDVILGYILINVESDG